MQGKLEPAALVPDKEGGGALRRLARHTSIYSIGSLLVTFASIISFPVFTRIFTVSEYGTMGLVTSTILFLVGVGKLGLQHSVVRFYSEVEAGTRHNTAVQFFSTVLFSMLATGAIVSVLGALLVKLMPTHWWGETQTQHLVVFAAPLILIRVVDSAMYNMLRAQQKSALYSTYFTVRKYLGLALILLVLFFVSRSLEGFFAASIVSEGLAVFVIITYYWRQHVFDVRKISKPLLFSMLMYGLPLFASELSGLLLNIGGRYIINYRLGPEPLGSFSAAYNFSDYLQGILTASFAQAIIPIYFRLWEQKGPEKTAAFLQDSLRYYMAISIPIVAGIGAVGPELVRLLASAKYNVSAPLITFVTAGMLISGGTPLFSAGVYIKKQTKIVMYSVLAAAVCNIALTIALTQGYGIEGAAVATLVSLTLYAASTAYFGRRTVQVRMPWRDLASFSALSLLMYGVITRIELPSLALRISAQIACGAVLYVGLLLLIDRPMRGLAQKGLSHLRRS
ncbi:oligosaccharide flippase family protein [Thiomonas sp. FB-Cd]|uniref:oligosaccharide flippase family protein n=1 Tax=Thiomonas sp. FB-Cd TaxID=1158292 RepID=UPI0004DFC298|nr:oligosaccharide flippase family protein [Thiomonas sp. FB-Cd]